MDAPHQEGLRGRAAKLDEGNLFSTPLDVFDTIAFLEPKGVVLLVGLVFLDALPERLIFLVDTSVATDKLHPFTTSCRRWSKTSQK